MTVSRLSLAAFASLPVIFAAAAAAQTTPPQGAASAAPQARPAEEEEVVVVAGRPRGSVPGDAVPTITLSTGDIRAQGVSSVTDLLSAISAQTGSARGRGSGQPVVLLNGRRVSSFREIARLPTEAIARVEVFNEDVALQYGFSPDQRVVNFILRSRFKLLTTEANVADLADHAGDRESAEAGYLRIRPQGRLQLNGTYSTQSAVTQAERGLFAPSGTDDRALRTVSPESESVGLTGVYAKDLSKTLAATGSFNFQASETTSLLGLDAGTGRAARSEGDSSSLRAAVSLDRAGPKWMGTGSLALQRDENERTVLRSTSPSRAKSEDTTVEAVGNLQGPIATLPTGKMRIAVRGNATYENLDSTSTRAGLTQSAGIDRTDFGARVTLSAPVITPDIESLARLGDVSVNASAAANSVSDFKTVTTLGAGLNWAPTDTLRFSLQGSWGETAPTLTQLGAPQQTTPNAIVFDPRTGQSVTATTISGGNPALDAERRNDLTFNASWSPKAIEGLTFNGSFVHNETRDGLSDFPGLTAAVEAAYPTRVIRTLSGALVSVDTRPINIAERTTDTLRVGFNLSRQFGPKITPPWGSGPPPWLPRAAAPAPDGQAAAPAQPASPADTRTWRPPPGFDPPPPGAGPAGAAPQGAGGFGGRGGGNWFRNARAGRFTGSVFYTRRLSDDLIFARGGPTIDLLDSAVLGGAGGEEKVEIEGGPVYRGLGLRLNGTWNSDYRVRGATPAQDLAFSDALTLNARLFMNFDSRPDLTHAYPILRGVRLTARADNLFDDAPDVRDATGATPFAYQKGLLAPQGRVVEIGVRKLF